MPRKCSICTHPKRAHINRALLNPKKSLREIAVQYGGSISTLDRHLKKHLLPAMKLAKKEAELKEAEDKYNGSMGALQVSWFREWRGMMELGFKLGMEDGFTIRQDDNSENPQMGFVQWKPQPDRPRAQPASLTPEEKEQLAIDPYASLEETAAEPPPADPVPPDSEKKQTPITPFEQTQSERDDPYGLKGRAADTTAELPADSAEKE